MISKDHHRRYHKRTPSARPRPNSDQRSRLFRSIQIMFFADEYLSSAKDQLESRLELCESQARDLSTYGELQKQCCLYFCYFLVYMSMLLLHKLRCFPKRMSSNRTSYGSGRAVVQCRKMYCWHVSRDSSTIPIWMGNQPLQPLVRAHLQSFLRFANRLIV